MPFSHEAPKPWCLDRIAELEPEQILDVGPGSGTWARLIRDRFVGCTLDCIEAFGPYIGQYGLDTLYDHVFLGDVRTWDWGGTHHVTVAESPDPIGPGEPVWTWDLIILGDVLEHMAKPEARAVVDQALFHADAVLVVVPVGEWPQGSQGGNPLEAHVAKWHVADLGALPKAETVFTWQTEDGALGAALLGEWP